MDIYLVGGAVRDRLLDLPVRERDWVVVGSSEDALLKQGYVRVGKDFPVFLHPHTKEEYALARTERKTAAGYKGFECDTNNEVTLEQDLARRDLTMNAIAEDLNGNLIDPFGGAEDIKKGIFKHVSQAFEEDPLRILRVARFSARFPQFVLDPDTFDLMRMMVSRGDLAELAAERIYVEIDKALKSETPVKFFRVLDDLSAGSRLWPELNESAFTLFEQVASLSDDREERIAALFWYLDKIILKKISARLKLPKQLTDLALLREYFETWMQSDKLDASEIVSWLYGIDAFRRTDRFKKINHFFDLISKITSQGVHGNCSNNWISYYELTTSISAKSFIPKYQGKELGQALRRAQIEKISRARN